MPGPIVRTLANGVFDLILEVRVVDRLDFLGHHIKQPFTLDVCPEEVITTWGLGDRDLEPAERSLDVALDPRSDTEPFRPGVLRGRPGFSLDDRQVRVLKIDPHFGPP
jgi:hypothetical protein